MRSSFVQDHKGMVWDLLLYVPTVSVLLTLAAKFWYGQDTNMAYLFGFLASFFLIAGANRILKTRLMLLPGAPVGLEARKDSIHLVLRNGQTIDLVKNIRFYSDYAGRSFGLSGMDSSGRGLQFVFHKGQFIDEREYKSMIDKLRSVSSPI